MRAVSKFLSYVLRHNPGEIDLTMDQGGWVAIDELLANAPERLDLDRQLLDQVVAANDKQRFAISPDQRRIRASQGHSIDVDLGLEPRTPPDVLYHGTATRFIDAILADGLQPGSRQHVHLSPDRATARAVGGRHGKPVVLTVDTAALHAAGQTFYLSDNGVWLTGPVDPNMLHRHDSTR